MRLIHHSPLGPLEIPGVLGTPAPGEPFDVDDDIAENLLVQSDLYRPAPDDEDGYDTLTVPQLKQIADDRGIDIKGATVKPAIIAALEAADAEEAGA